MSERKMKTKILVLLSVPFILCACSSPEAPEIPMMMIHIEGVVTDFNTNKPIENAEITVFSCPALQTCKVYFKVYTNHEGYYSIHEPLRGCRKGFKIGSIRAEKKGYKTVCYSSDHKPDCTEDLQKIDFQLEYMCDIPELISPAEGAVLDNGRTDKKDYIKWHFSWAYVEGASMWRLYVKHVGSKYPVIDRDVFNVFYNHEEYGSYIANCNRFNWKWKVRAYVYDMWCDWSEERSFDVEPVNTDPPSDE
jgi:hypothetical protein